MNVVGLLRKKALRRIALLAVLVAPIIYLFGTQIGALAGAHGEEVLAEDFTSSSVTIETTSFEDGNIATTTGLDTYADNTIRSIGYIDILSPRFEVNASFNRVRSLTTYFYDNNSVYLGYSTTRIFPPDTSLSVAPDYISGASKIRMVFSGDTRPSIYSCSIDFKNTSNYRNTLFNNMFGQSNFLTDWGQKTLDNSAGLEPVNALLKFIAEEGLNISKTNIGLMGIGYATYLIHAIMIYEFIVLAVELLTIPLKIGDWFTKGVNKE